jgi:hypothetical protein
MYKTCWIWRVLWGMLKLSSWTGSARAVDEWFVLGEQTIKAVDQGGEIDSEGGR